MKKLILGLLVITLMGCGEETANVSINLDESFVLGEGETGIMSDPAISVIIDSVNDSRCPDDVQCIWEGEAKVKFRFQRGDDLVIDSLSTFNGVTRNIDGLMIELLEVTPYPTLNNQKKDKTIRLIIREN